MSSVSLAALDLQERFLLASHSLQDLSPLGVSTGDWDMATGT